MQPLVLINRFLLNLQSLKQPESDLDAQQYPQLSTHRSALRFSQHLSIGNIGQPLNIGDEEQYWEE